jgi:hypothetical protein
VDVIAKALGIGRERLSGAVPGGRSDWYLRPLVDIVSHFTFTFWCFLLKALKLSDF